MSPAEERYLTASQVRDRFGKISRMTLYRYLHDPDTNFPQPVLIGSHRMWRLSDLLAYEQTLQHVAA